MANPAALSDDKSDPIRFQKFDDDDKKMIFNHFSEIENVWTQALTSISSLIQTALQELRNKVAPEKPSPIKTAKQIFISIGFGLNTLFGILETATRFALFVLPFLAAFAFSWATNAGEEDLSEKICELTAGSVIKSTMYTIQSAASIVTNHTIPNRKISYRGQFNWLFDDHPPSKANIFD